MELQLLWGDGLEIVPNASFFLSVLLFFKILILISLRIIHFQYFTHLQLVARKGMGAQRIKANFGEIEQKAANYDKEKETLESSALKNTKSSNDGDTDDAKAKFSSRFLMQEFENKVYYQYVGVFFQVLHLKTPFTYTAGITKTLLFCPK